MKNTIIIIITSFLSVNLYCQVITYNDLNISSETLKESLNNSGEYFNNMPHVLPYFQGKSDSKFIKFHNSIGIVVRFEFKSESEYLTLINQIQNNAEFVYKSCTNYEQTVTYNYLTSLGNSILFNFNDLIITVKYPSDLDNVFDRNFEVLEQVFVCISNDAYAFHTNLKCEGLGNCDAEIAKTTIKHAKSYNYKFCKICTSDNKSKTLLTEVMGKHVTHNNDYEFTENDYEFTENDYEFTENDYEYDDESYNYEDYSPNELNPIAKKAEKMFAKYLPKILESKGEGAFIDLQRTYIGDFTNDGIDDVIIWFNYSFGGNAIAGYECAFYETVGNTVKVVGGFEPDYIFSINKVENGIVYAEKIQYADDDARCCPSIRTPIELIYRDNRIYTNEK